MSHGLWGVVCLYGPLLMDKTHVAHETGHASPHVTLLPRTRTSLFKIHYSKSDRKQAGRSRCPICPLSFVRRGSMVSGSMSLRLSVLRGPLCLPFPAQLCSESDHFANHMLVSEFLVQSKSNDLVEYEAHDALW